jgi:hypothetical protein
LDTPWDFDYGRIVELGFQVKDFSCPLSKDHSLGNFTRKSVVPIKPPTWQFEIFILVVVGLSLLKMHERVFMFFLIFVIMVKAPSVQILTGLAIISWVWAWLFHVTYITIQNITDSFFFIRILFTRNTFWPATYITFSWVWIYQ